MQNKIKIMLVDDHRIFRDGIKSLLTDADDFDVIAEASNGNELLKLLEDNKPDIIIMDITLPNMSGIELTKSVLLKYPDIKILILSMHTNEDFVVGSILNGAMGYLHKDTSKKELFEALLTISKGEEYYGSLISASIIKSYIRKKQLSSFKYEKEQALTQREVEIIQLVGMGLANKEIADKLSISVRTVDSHKNQIMQKLKLRSTADMIIWAVKNKIIEI